MYGTLNMTITVRPNQKNLSAKDWTNFINAVNSMHGIGTKAPAYRDFVKLHADAMTPMGMSWGVHTMPGMGMIGTNFLAWHRQFIFAFETRLGIPLPYWDWISDPVIPKPLTDKKLLASWGVTRHWNPKMMPTAAQLQSQIQSNDFSVFQHDLETGAHNKVHNAIGGNMAGSSSPSDPIFFLHHANIDRIWSEWQKMNPNSNPPNKNDTLMPGPPIQGVKISSILDISKMGYSYQ